MPEEYNSNTANLISINVKKTQRHMIGTRITKEDINNALKEIEARSYGEVDVETFNDANIGKVKITLQFFWYGWRRKKWVDWQIACSHPASHEETYGGVRTTLKNIKKDSVWRTVFPERHRRYVGLCLYRQLCRRGYILPPDIKDIVIVDDKYGMVLIFSRNTEGKYGRYLCSPLGYAKVEYYTGSVISAARSIGIRIPRDKEKRAWENIEPQWVIAQLQKL
jgi:hypothetical protein